MKVVQSPSTQPVSFSGNTATALKPMLPALQSQKPDSVQFGKEAKDEPSSERLEQAARVVTQAIPPIGFKTLWDKSYKQDRSDLVRYLQATNTYYDGVIADLEAAGVIKQATMTASEADAGAFLYQAGPNSKKYRQT
jgi:hypothetical protein